MMAQAQATAAPERLSISVAATTAPAGARGDLAVVASVHHGLVHVFLRGALDRFAPSTIHAAHTTTCSG